MNDFKLRIEDLRAEYPFVPSKEDKMPALKQEKKVVHQDDDDDDGSDPFWSTYGRQ